MKSRKNFLKAVALCMVLFGISSYSLCTFAEDDEESSELSFAEESIYEEESELSYEEEESDNEEESSDEEFSEIEESSYYYVDDEESSDDDGEFSYDYEDYEDYEESSDYYGESSYYEPSYYEPSYYEPSIYHETTEYYYDDEESSEPSSSYHEISVDSSELTSKDWEKLRERLSSEMKNKSSDTAIRDIKDSDSEHNDNIGYLIWGLVLIAMGLVLIAFIIYTTIYTKRKFS